MTSGENKTELRDIRLLQRLVRKLTEELEQANERLFLATQVKSEFLAHISGEFRRPLNHIIDFGSYLREGALGELNEEQKGCIDEILTSSCRLREMMNRVLELCNTNIGMAVFLPKSLRVAEVIGQALKENFELAGPARVTLDISAGDEQRSIEADEEKFHFILHELVANALRFSPEGSRITVKAREVELAGNGKRKFLEVTVADQGVGIPEEKLENIFAGFERGGQHEGLGIGLALVRRFVELHGGKIWVESHPGVGSTFTFILPLEGPLAGASPLPRILVADADGERLKMLKGQLRDAGYETVTATDGLVALHKGISLRPDLCLLEVALPELDGIRVCERLKSQKRSKHIPVIIMAPAADQEVKLRSARAGADSFFVTPADPGELLLKIKNLVTQKLNYDYLMRNYEIAASEAFTDSLTGLFNLRQFWSNLDHELERAARYRHSCSLAMVDIDYFKHYNDSHGHLQGDEVLRQAAEIFRENIRNSDIAARYGGEEFVVIMPETGKDVALLVGEKLRQAFEDHPFPLQQSQPGGCLTISVGIATFPDDAKSPRELVDKADQALYQGKEQGRNRVVAYED